MTDEGVTMKFLYFLLAFSFNAFGEANCDQRYQNDKWIVSKCTLEDRGAGIEAVFKKEYCVEQEGGPKVPCYVIRTCPKNRGDRGRKSPIFIRKYADDGGYCANNKPHVTLRHEKYGMQATFQCEKNAVKSVLLEIKGKSKDCLLDFKEKK